MDHTEGFDEVDQNEIEESNKENSSKKGRKSSKSKTQSSSQETNEVRALAQKRRIIFQLETLAEFADYHLKISESSSNNNNNIGYLNLLNEACLLKRPSKGFFISYSFIIFFNIDIIFYIEILRDWNNILKLITQNNDEDEINNVYHNQSQSQELNSIYISIILRLCSQSAQVLKNQYLSIQQKELKKNKKNNGNGHSNDSNDGDENDEILENWNELQDCLRSSSVSLLIRFRGDELQLESVLELLECVDITSIEGKDLKILIKSFMELFETIQSEVILSKMGKVIRLWLLQESNQQNTIIHSLKQLKELCWSKVLDLIQSTSPSVEKKEGEEKQQYPEKRKRGRGNNIINKIYFIFFLVT